MAPRAAAVDGARQRDLAVLDHDLDLDRIEMGIVGQHIAHMLADPVVGARVALGPDSAIRAAVRPQPGARPAPGLFLLRSIPGTIPAAPPGAATAIAVFAGIGPVGIRLLAPRPLDRIVVAAIAARPVGVVGIVAGVAEIIVAVVGRRATAIALVGIAHVAALLVIVAVAAVARSTHAPVVVPSHRRPPLLSRRQWPPRMSVAARGKNRFLPNEVGEDNKRRPNPPPSTSRDRR